METFEQPMQIIVVALLRPGAGGSLTLEDLRRRLSARLDRLPALRCRVIPVPLGLAHPVMVRDPHFDLGKHLHHAIVPAPGGLEGLDAACAQLVSQCLDRSRPLWRITLIDGLANGRQAMVVEVHHALMDGFAIRTTLTRIFSEEEQPAALPSPSQPGRMPGCVQLFARALAYDARMLARLPELVVRARRASRAVHQRQAGAAVKVPKPGVDVPLSVINSGFTPERRVARVSLSLGDVLAVKEVAGVTVNDVALALVGGALRSYLRARGTLPDRPLVAFVPVGLDGPETASRAEGNRISCLDTSLATDIADPWERLQLISAVTVEAKTCLDLLGRELWADWLECIPPMLMRPMSRRREAARRRPDKRKRRLDFNVVVSNLRGPSVPWQFGSTIVEEAYFAPPGDGAGVIFGLWDYAGYLNFGIVSFTDAVKDPAELATDLSRCLEELVAAAERRRVPTA